MSRQRKQELPAALVRARGRFELWRKSRRGKGRVRIPESLWATAARAAREFGLHRTSRVLRLDYMTLKSRVAAEQPSPRETRDETVHRFVELLPASGTNGATCVVELEHRSGSRMRIELGGIAPPDVVALTRSLRGDEG